MMRLHGPARAETTDGSRPAWNLVLRALREAGGVTRDGWAAALGYGRTTVQRWETGETAPDAAAEQAILAECHARGLFRLLERGPLAGLDLTPESLSRLLAEARLARGGRTAVADVTLGEQGGARAPDAQAPTRETRRPSLPAPLTRFVGRQAEMAEVGRLLRETRLLTLTGAGGCGKTRLAVETAHGLLDTFAGGVYLVELAPVTDPALLTTTVAAALALREVPGQPLDEALAGYLRDRELLLILDNCEHLIAACAALTGTLLGACPRLSVLATSRVALGITGEVVWRVPSLSLPDLERPPSIELLAEYEATRLFLDRARAVDSACVSTDESAAAVAQICRRVDGIPLAIELAAARMNVLSVEQIAARLDDRFGLLTRGSSVALPRQQTLRASIDWSYDLLAPPERRLFDRLAVFAGGFTLDAAEEICGDGDLLDPLSGLINHSLVIAEHRGQERRYRLLETLRAYARERLWERGELASLRGRHRDFYLRFAERAEPALRGPEQARWFERLTAEYGNLQAALEWCREERNGAEPALRLARALWRLWQLRGRFAQGRAWLDQALALHGEVSAVVRAYALNAAGMLAHAQGDVVAARRYLHECLECARSSDDRSCIATALTSVGSILSDPTEATALLEESLAIRKALGQDWEMGVVLHNLGHLAERQSDDARAVALYESSLAVRRKIGDVLGSARTLNNLGSVAQRRGELARSRSLLEECLVLRRQLGDESGSVETLHGLGEAAWRQGDQPAAASWFAESLRTADRLGQRRGVAYGLEGLAAVAAVRGRARDATRWLGAAAALREAIGAALLESEREMYESIVATARAGQDEALFTATWRDGRAMALDAAIAQALNEAMCD